MNTCHASVWKNREGIPDKAFCTERYEYIVMPRHFFFFFSSHLSVSEITDLSQCVMVGEGTALELDCLGLNPRSATYTLTCVTLGVLLNLSVSQFTGL